MARDFILLPTNRMGMEVLISTYCEWKNDYWTDPVNLGPVINTKK